MTRLVLDTNIVVAGLLWHGPPRLLIERAVDAVVTLYSSSVLIEELTNTFGYAKFAQRIAQQETGVAALVARYEAMCVLVSPTHTPRKVLSDPDDDHVLACALAATAHLIVSGDRDLLDLKAYQGIPIVTAAEALARLSRP